MQMQVRGETVGPLIVDEYHAPPLGGMGGSIHSWERGLDPWHKEAFQKEFRDQVPRTEQYQGERRVGWYGLDWCGNVITFVADGTQI